MSKKTEAPKNYQDLTDRMLKLFDDLETDKINIDRANSMIKASNAVVNIQKAKIFSTRVTGENIIKFFQD
jgi:hypothetical protein